jgi:hypothetical protein
MRVVEHVSILRLKQKRKKKRSASNSAEHPSKRKKKDLSIAVRATDSATTAVLWCLCAAHLLSTNASISSWARPER